MRKEGRVVYYDVLNILACMSVVILHHNGIVHHFSDSIAWKQALVVEVLCYWAVPVFFMLSGATLLNYRERYSTSVFFKERFKRTIIPFLIWTLVWILICHIRDGISLNIRDIIMGIIHVEYQPVYWFFIPLFGLYVLMPVLSLLKGNVKLITYLAIFIFISISVVNPLMDLFGLQRIGYLQNAMAGPILYALLGKLLSTHNTNKLQYSILTISTIFCLFMRYYITYHMSIAENELNRVLFGYYYFTAVIPSIWVFTSIKKWSPTELSLRKTTILKVISSCSLGIYLLHNMVMAVEIRMFSLEPESFSWRVIMPLVTYILCLTIVYITKKTKLGKFIFP